MHLMMGWTHNASPSLWLCDPTGLQHHVLPRNESWEKTHGVVYEEGGEDSHHFWRALPVLALISNSWRLQLKQAKKSPTYILFLSYPQASLALSICKDSKYLLHLSNVRWEGGASKKKPKITSTKVDDFGNKGLGNNYIGSCLADSSKEYGADKWREAGSSNLLSYLGQGGHIW